MRYVSTRGSGGSLGYEDVLLTGLARDGGLFIPESWPRLSHDEWMALKGKSYLEIAQAIISRFTGDDLSSTELQQMLESTYKDFNDPAIAPLRPMGDNIHLCELFHGPTIAFKDYAMQFLSRGFDHALEKRGRRAVIVGATSGDTGSAALEAFKGRDFVDIFIMFPDGRVSEVQRRQMTSVLTEGAFALAVDGDFDACQDTVKALFQDLAFRDEVELSAINSINWARLLPQIVYYASSALSVGAPEQEVAFSVPTGNFGNIFAGYAAFKMGLPIHSLICVSNRNDILTRFFMSGKMERRGVDPSLSPSMDIQVSSNFERLLFELLERDGAAVQEIMEGFARNGSFSVTEDVLASARQLFKAWRLDDAGTLAEIKRTYAETGIVLDPHSAVGFYGARMARAESDIPADMPIISLACAHPGKFPDAVAEAVGERPSLPPHLSDLMTRPERSFPISSAPEAIASFIQEHRRRSC